MSDPVEQIADAVTALGPKRMEVDGQRYEGRDFADLKAYAEWQERRASRTKVPFRFGKIAPDGAT